MFQYATLFNQTLCWDLTDVTTANIFADSLGSSSTTADKCLCFAGTYYNVSACFACSAGTSSSEAVFKGWSSIDDCASCSAGKAAVAGSTECSTCSVGYFAGSDASTGTTAATVVTEGALFCIPCPSGYYSEFQGAVTCTACSSGTSASARGSTNCSVCRAGAYSEAAANNCTACASGTYKTSSGLGLCGSCDVGKFALLKGSTSCTVCAAGSAQGASGQASCDTCTAGTYASSTGATGCALCDVVGVGYTSMAGASSCSLCRAGYFQVPSTGDCIVCPDNMNCQEETGILLPGPKESYWLPLSYASEFVADIDLYSCPRLTCRGSRPTNASACWNAANFSRCDFDAVLCRTGAKGPLCGACSDGYIYSSTSQTCIGCGDSWGLVGFFVVVLLALGVQYVRIHLQKKFVAVVSTRVVASMKNSRFLGTIKCIDSGTFRVCWSNYQVRVGGYYLFHPSSLLKLDALLSCTTRSSRAFRGH